MSNLTSVGVTSGQGSSGTGSVSTIDALMADGGQATLGAQANAASTATDTTPVTAMSVWKQISKSAQAIASAVAGVLGVSIASGGVASGAVASGAFASGAIADGAQVTLGTKADAKNSATDTTAITIMSVLKQVSASIQAAAASLAATLIVVSKWVAGSGVGFTWTAAIGSADLTSLTSAYSVLASSAAIANQTALDKFCDVSVSIPSVTTAGVPYLGVYLYPLNQDGSTYGDGQFTAGTGSAAVPGSTYWKGSIAFPVGTQVCVARLPASLFPLAVSCFCFRTAWREPLRQRCNCQISHL